MDIAARATQLVRAVEDADETTPTPELLLGAIAVSIQQLSDRMQLIAEKLGELELERTER